MFQQYKLTYWSKLKMIFLGAYEEGHVCAFYMDTTNMKKKKSNQSQVSISDSYQSSLLDAEDGRDPVKFVNLPGQAASSMRSPSNNDSKQANSQEDSLEFNPVLARLYKKFIRFLLGRRIVQLISITSISILIYYTLQDFDDETFGRNNEYILLDDLLSWLQVLAWLTVMWYCWIPFRRKNEPNSLLQSLDQTIQNGGFTDSQSISKSMNEPK